MSATWIGIDPGNEGALAAMHSNGFIEIIPMPLVSIGNKGKHAMDGRKVKLWLQAIGIKDIHMVLIEQAIVMPEQGAVSAATFVGGQKHLTGVCEGLGLPYREIHPRTWKKAMGFPAGAPKSASIEMAEYIFEDRINLKRGKKGKPDHNMAEAALLAYLAWTEELGSHAG